MRIEKGIALCRATFFWLAMLMGCKSDRANLIPFEFKSPTLVTCSLEPGHQYYVTLPDQPDPDQKYPLIIAIDPHGDGLLALQKFRDALKDLPVIIAGSNKVRNNYAGFEASLKSLYNDLLTKYPVDPQHIIIAGFSGGARMALFFGMKYQVHAVIMFGAGPGQMDRNLQNIQIYAVSGTRDFNFNEQYRSLFKDMGSSASYVTDYFRGTHEWPPECYIREASIYCLREINMPYQALSRELSFEFIREADSLKQINDLFFAGKSMEKAWYFATDGKQKEILSADIRAFEQNPDWITSQQKIEALLKSEDDQKRYYIENLTDPDTTWWSKEFGVLMMQLHTGTDSSEIDYYYRIKGFLGIYLYSRINQILQSSPSGDLIERMIRIYEMVEPDSEDLVKFKVELEKIKSIS